MSYGTPSLDEILADDRRRISALESAVYVYGDDDNTNNEPLTITGLSGSISYYYKPVTGEPAARIVWSWDAIDTPDPDDLTADPVVDYMISVTAATSPEIEPYVSTKGETTTTTTNHPLNTQQTARVYAVTKKGLKGPIASATANIVADLTPPPQPSTPTVTAALKGVRVEWDGLDSSAAAMPVDFDFVEVHASTTGGLTFTPTSATLFDRIYSGRGVTFVPANSSYDEIFVRLVAIDKSKNASIASTGASAVPQKAVSTDLGVVLPGDIGFNDVDNLIADGSFENEFLRIARLSAPQAGTWTWDNTAGFADHGTYSLKVSGAASPSQKYFYVQGYGTQLAEFTVPPDTKVYCSAKIRGVSANGNARMVVRWTLQDGSTSEVVAFTESTPTGTYELEEAVLTVPSDVKSAAVYVDTNGHTTGTWYFDSLQVRRVMPTQLIEDAAITRAKIADLAVGNAQIEDLNAAKLWAQSISTDKIQLGVFNRNLVADPSFEETYSIDTDSADNKLFWRKPAAMNGGSGTVTRNAVVPGSGELGVRSGQQSLILFTPSGGTSKAGVYSNVIPVEPGDQYVVTIFAAQYESTGSSRLYLRVAGGSTEDLTEYTASTPPGSGSPTAAIPWDGDDSTFGENVALDVGFDRAPLPVEFQTLSGAFTVPSGVNFVSVLLYLYQTTNDCHVYIDDVSMTKLGAGATEITSAGIRLFDEFGQEAAAIVANRPNYFSVFKDGATIAAISEDGEISGQDLTITNDPVVQGMPLVGKLGNTLPDIVDFLNEPVTYDRDYEVDPIGIIEQYAKGTVAWGQWSGSDFTQTITSGQEMGLFEIGFDSEPGRQYTFRMNPILLQTSGTGYVGIRLRYTSNGAIPSMTSSVMAYDYQYSATTYCSLCIPSRLYNGGATSQTQWRVLLCIFSNGPTVSVYDSQSILASIEDLGPVKEITGTVRNYKTGGTTSSTTPAVKTYTKTYTANNHATYRGNGTKRTDTSDVVQGYNSYNGNGKGLWTFPSMTSDLSGATVKKIEVYAYANHWYYNSGGTAVLKVHGYTSPPASSPSMTSVKSISGWPKPGGKWVTLPSSFYAGFKSGTYRGFGMGPAPSNSLTYYGRFNGTGAKIRVTYTK